jgi:hypothetical protein
MTGHVIRQTVYRAADWSLSLAISRPGREPRPGLRSLLTHRLRSAPKAIARLPNARSLTDADPEDYSMFCEPCDHWYQKPDWDADWTCPECGTVYVAEMVIFSAVLDEEDS